MKNPLYITECVRKDGVTYLTVLGNELTEADEGGTVKVMGVQNETVNGEFPILKIIPPDTIRFLQPNQLDIPAGIRGGAISTEAPEHPKAVVVVIPPKPVEAPKAATAPAQPAVKPESKAEEKREEKHEVKNGKKNGNHKAHAAKR